MKTRGKTRKVKQISLDVDPKPRRDHSKNSPRVPDDLPFSPSEENSDFSESEEELIESMPISPIPIEVLQNFLNLETFVFHAGCK
jgi:hypothetical protein